MTRNHDRDRVGAIGEAYGPTGFRISDSVGQLTVGNGRAVRNLAEAAPDSELKRGTLGRELQIEILQLAGEISMQLTNSLAERSSVFFPR